MDKVTVAICYDFDKTLATNDMQTFSFIPNLEMSSADFWKKCNDLSKKTGIESTLSYLRVMIDECEKKGIKLTREYLNKLGKDVKFFDGVTTWFKRINRYADKHDINIEHYIISSGNREIIEGCSIFKEFKNVYGCEFLYNDKGEAYWPKMAVNYTQKTQFLFRICKGADDTADENIVNSRVAKKRVEFQNMIYIGDGLTDIPCMTLVKEKGGTAISVYQANKKQVSVDLLKDNRVNYACRSDFRNGSPLENLVKLILDSIALKERLVKRGGTIK